MQKYAINGRFIVRKQTGQERFASELIRELDKLDLKDEFVLVVPEYAQNIPQYSSILPRKSSMLVARNFQNSG